MFFSLGAMVALTGNDWGLWHLLPANANMVMGAGIASFIIVLAGWCLDSRP